VKINPARRLYDGWDLASPVRIISKSTCGVSRIGYPYDRLARSHHHPGHARRAGARCHRRRSPGMGFLEFFASANHGEPSSGSSRDTNISPRVTGGNPSLRDRARLYDTPDFHIETETIGCNSSGPGIGSPVRRGSGELDAGGAADLHARSCTRGTVIRSRVNHRAAPRFGRNLGALAA
jgi:hypothetical protein